MTYYRERERAICARLLDHYGFAPMASDVEIKEEGDGYTVIEVAGVRYKVMDSCVYLIGRY